MMSTPITAEIRAHFFLDNRLVVGCFAALYKNESE
jgi:hypothetical protein